jgi:methyl-accepting chemotaxis protein
VREIGEISDSNTDAVNQASKTAEQQAQEAEALSALIRRFKV